MLINSVEELAKWKAQKGPLFSYVRIPREDRAPLNRGKWLLYVRQDKRAYLYFGGRRIGWRRPPTLASLWARAWDRGWRSGWAAGYAIAHKMLSAKAGMLSPPKPPKEETGQ